MDEDVLFHTPPPVTQETQTQQETQRQEDAPMLRRGTREHHDPNRNRLSPSGPRQRKTKTRYRKHNEVWNFYRCMRHIYVPFDVILCIRHICICVRFDVILCIRHIISYSFFTQLLKLPIERGTELHFRQWEGRFGARAHLSPDAFPFFLNFKNASKKSEKKICGNIFMYSTLV